MFVFRVNQSIKLVTFNDQKLVTFNDQKLVTFNPSEVPNTFVEIPYDLFCPSATSVVIERTCKICDIYFASKVILQPYTKEHKCQHLVRAVKVCPTPIAARRQRELMVIIAENDFSPIRCLNLRKLNWQLCRAVGAIFPPLLEVRKVLLDAPNFSI